MKKDKYKPFIEGKRLYLREVLPEDVNENYHCWMNDPEVMKFLESRFYPNSIESLRKYVQETFSNRENVFLAIVIKKDGRHIGNIKLGPINWLHRFADVGIMIGAKDCWGKGYGAEAIRLVTEYAFMKLNLHKLTAGAYANNMGSVKAFQNAGWEQEGRRRQLYYCNGNYVDAVLLGVVCDNYKKAGS